MIKLSDTQTTLFVDILDELYEMLELDNQDDCYKDEMNEVRNLLEMSQFCNDFFINNQKARHLIVDFICDKIHLELEEELEDINVSKLKLLNSLRKKI